MIEVIATICGILFGIIATFLSLRSHIRELKHDYDRRLAEEMGRQSEAKVKEYGAERDIAHLQRNNEQLKAVVLEMQDEYQELRKTVLELQITSRGAFNRIEQIAARLEGGNTLGGR